MIIVSIKKKGVNKNVVSTISHSEYKDVLLNNKCFRHYGIQSKDHRIEAYKISKTYRTKYIF